MRKLTLFALALCFSAFSFAQNQGQWSFGAGGDFTAPGAGDDNFNANEYDFKLNLITTFTNWTDLCSARSF